MNIFCPSCGTRHDFAKIVVKMAALQRDGKAPQITDFCSTLLDCDECGGRFRIERVNAEPVPISEMPRKLLAMTRSRLAGR
jgi:uncharacterized Zn finger protein